MGDEIEPLLDDELWGPLWSVLEAAEREVILTQLWFDPGIAPGGRKLSDVLEALAGRGVDVRILVNENAAIPDSYDELRERFEGTAVQVVRFPMSPNVMHAKLILVDGVDAFLVDPPFQPKYLDDRAHAFHAPTAERGKPFHTVSARVRGAPARGLHAFARDLFACAGVDGPSPAPQERPSDRVRLARTLPAGVVPEGEVLEILAEYERAIASAQRFVYIETQYFTSPRIARDLRDALAREPRLEVVLLLNERMDIPGYDGIQLKRLREIEHPRLAAFSLWSPRRVEGALAARQTYLHSKVAIVDDAWATIGSANLDSISLHEADEFPMRAPPNVEVNAVVEDAPWATRLRRRLWGEHLRDEGVWRADTPPGGWLALWRNVAEENARRFAEGDAEGVGRVFAFGALTSGRRGASANEDQARTRTAAVDLT